MKISDIRDGMNIGFFGLGRSNISLLRILPLDNAQITLRSEEKISFPLPDFGAKVTNIYEGKDAFLNINEDLLILSPSVRRERGEISEAVSRGVKISSDYEIFLAENDRPIFAVTGSDGKSTTATLTNMMLCSSGRNSLLIGNIGQPLTEMLNRAEMYVCELSSFMLRYALPKAKRGCLTNITPNHLNWHKDFEEYKKTKISMLKSCSEFVISEENCDISGAFAIVSLTSSEKELVKKYRANLYYTLDGGWICKNGKRLICTEEIKIKQGHNLQNLMMAMAMTDGYCEGEGVLDVAREFEGLSHRCEKFLSFSGVDYYDSSIDSTPARTVATLKALNRNVVVILGGQGKGLDYSALIPCLKKYAKLAVIVGENGDEIFSTVRGELEAKICHSFEEAVGVAIEYAKDVGALVLSPASTSYDRFSDYKERGNYFKRLVKSRLNID